MKRFFAYLRQRRRAFAVGAVCCAVFAVSFRLYHLPVSAVLYPSLLCAAICLAACAADFFRAWREHEALGKIRTIVDAAAEAFPKAEGIRDENYQRIIRLLREEHQAYRLENERRYADMIEYYTVWAHQIKTPIASMRLHLQNEDSPLSRKLTGDLHRVEQYVEMVLAFLRLHSESTDYVIREQDLDVIVRQAVKNFSAEFISRKLSLRYEPLNATVITDEKWLSFVIEQVLSNALKYTPSGSVSITLEAGKTLRIRDTGIGIAPEDLPRIFENGYTGYNGRINRSASGLGLYLCKRICTSLGHTITARSVVGEGTAIDIGLAQKQRVLE